MPGQWQTMIAGSPGAITSGSRPPLPSAVMNWSTEPRVSPSQPPNQSPVQPMIETTHSGLSRVDPGGELDPRGDALLRVGEQVPEVVRDLGLEHVAARPGTCPGQGVRGSCCRTRRAS